MKLKIFKKLLNRYHHKEANEAETELVDSWYASFGEDRDIEPLQDSTKKRELRNSMHAHITKKINSGPGIRIRMIPYLKVAAVLLLIGTVAAYCYQNFFLPVEELVKYTYVSAGQGKMKKLTLPDSTELWLNAGSTVHYNAAFTKGKSRVIVLDRGEVFFEVKPDKNKPFIVHAAALQTRVLGTSFNIRSYEEIDEVKVTVLTGRVQVNHKNKLLGVLLPGQEIVYHKKTDSATTGSVNASQSNAWINGETYLRQASFNELALSFKNKYNITLIAGNKAVKEYRYSIKLDQTTPIEHIVKAICSIHQSKYRRHGDEIVIY